MAKPLQVDQVWLDRIAGLLNDMEFGSLQIVVHEGQIVQMERTERKRYDNTSPQKASAHDSSLPASRPLRTSNGR